MSTFKDPALGWTKRGAFVFPLRSTKRPNGQKGWRERGATPEQIAAWPSSVTGYGIDCESARLVVLDEDRPGAVAELEQLLGISLPPTLTVSTGRIGGGRHVIFEHDHEVCRIGNREPSGWPDGLNIRGAGGFIVGTGSQHFDSRNQPTGNWYEVAEDVPIAPLPSELADWLSTGSATKTVQTEDGCEMESSDRSCTETEREWADKYLREACDRIRSAQEGTRNQTLRDKALPVCSLVKAGYLDSHDAETALADAAADAGLPPGEVGATITNAIKDADPERGPRPSLSVAEMFDVLDPLPPMPDEADVQRELRLLRARTEARRRFATESVGAADRHSDYMTLDDLDALPAMPWFIDGRLPEGYALLTGRDGTFKTFIALDMALSIAAGIPWQGRAVTQARVLYVAGEGARNINNRVRAWLTAHPEVARADLVDQFTVRTSAPNFYAAGTSYEDLLHNASGYGVVVLDTLRRISGAADGNGSDMATVVDRIADLVRVLDHGTGGLALVIAHTQKNDTDTRGYSGIEDDADAVLHTNRQGASMHVTVEVSKQKDGEDGAKDHLTLMSVTLSSTDSSLTVDPQSLQPMPNETPRQERERLILEHLDAVRNIGAAAGEVVAALGGGHNRTTINKHLSELVGKGRIEKQGQRYYPGSTESEAIALGFRIEPDVSDADEEIDR
ncbi:hypothetical protein Back2_10850 [Nocardioides baekrokdamisoli]|uniref:DNA primase/polymerase bifunctional N-terminal domain-containing protein n=1 Tax=Nocardioides baekrokdamisoli TaxID=1804624 RepID=A0A3G9IZM7_9ACTN|nr:AAA family ATPase [Nocardioides baekrokdamisoli]BBH16798.1 hypothetical protein Back2_10850 [Nocardioides baekrokdamisoli]